MRKPTPRNDGLPEWAVLMLDCFPYLKRLETKDDADRWRKETSDILHTPIADADMLAGVRHLATSSERYSGGLADLARAINRQKPQGIDFKTYMAQAGRKNAEVTGR